MKLLRTIFIPDHKFYRKVLLLALPISLQSLITIGVNMLDTIMVGTLGEQELSAASLANQFINIYHIFCMGLGICLGLFAGSVILLISRPIIGAYNVSAETAVIAQQLMNAISFIMIFQSANSIMTKGVLRGGGDTKMLMLADNIFLWVLSIPLGLLAGFVFHVPAFWIYTALKFDQIAKAVWCVFRLRGGKWIKKITTGNVK